MDGKDRNQLNKINRLLNTFPVVVILGPRQCGKSTLAKMLGQSWEYFDLEKPSHYQQIMNDPELFFQEYPDKVIIDEAQISPKIFEVLRSVIDSDRGKKGRFILTGSSSFELMTQISESLAGRVALVELSPFKMNELNDEPLSDFFALFNQKLETKNLNALKGLVSRKSINEIKHYLLWGGYPEPTLSASETFRLDWQENYFDTYINRDMRTLFPRLDFIKYRRVVGMLASLSGTIINKSDIARSVEASEKTCRDYLDIISGTFFWRDLEAFHTSKIKTTTKLPKGHFRDSGMALYLQNIHSVSDLNLFPRLGNVFESFVIEEVIRGVQSVDARNFRASHFRTKAGGEIDLILEGSFGILPIEIKLQSSTTKSSLTSLRNFVDLHSLPYGIVLNNCDRPSMITEKIIQIPVGCL
jgi:uncharacterized protein